MYSYLLKGDLDLSITMTTISTVAALGKHVQNLTFELRHEKNMLFAFLHMRKQRRRSAAQLFSTFVFAINLFIALFVITWFWI